MSRKYIIPKICVSATLLVGGITSVLQAQQVPLYQQYFYNRFVYNPAYAGYDNASNVYLIHRAQWSEMPGQPTTTAITLDGPLKSKKIGLGVSLYSDRTDITSRVGAYGSFAYNIGIGKDQNLMFGISMGGLENRIDFSQIIAKDLDDPAILASMERKKGLDGTFGIGYRWKELHFGVAIPQILASSFEFSDANGGGSRAHYNLSRHYMTSLEYKFFVNPDKDVALTPMFLVRYMPEAPMQFDANLIFNWRETAFLAISYRSDYAIGVNARVKLKEKISIGYTYDVISSSINAYSGISHEIMLGYTFGGTSIVDESELEELQERIDSLADELAAKKLAIELKEALKDVVGNEDISGLNVSVQSTGNGAIITLEDDPVHGMFRIGSARPRQDMILVMAKIAKVISSKSGKITISGHTDGRKYKSLGYDNWRLSTSRAHMARYMLVQGGLEESRVERIDGYADSKLKIPDDELAAPNRRIEIFLKNP